MSFKLSIQSLFLLAATLPLAACVQTTPRWDSQFGQSVRTAIASQTLRPQAAANPDPVTGIDGKAALGAQQRYEHAFAQPEPPPAILVNTVGK
jgi:hypothetical protein